MACPAWGAEKAVRIQADDTSTTVAGSAQARWVSLPGQYESGSSGPSNLGGG
jgi:hypothetical protein